VTEESRPGPTPNGGAKSTMFYLDDAGEPAEREVATQAVIVEYDAQGAPIHRTYGTFNRSAPSDTSTPTA
jgi:hypothetical protein